MTEEYMEETEELDFAVKKFPDPTSGQLCDVVYHEKQNVALFCVTPQDANRLCDLLNRWQIGVVVY
jgi:hypothetical protein